MAKSDLLPITGGADISIINNNFDKIETALNEGVLWRNSGNQSPNQMENDLDMNGKRIYNLPAPSSLNEPLRVQDFVDAGGTVITLNPEAKDIPVDPITGVTGNTVQTVLEGLNNNDKLAIQTTYPTTPISGNASTNANRLVGFDSSGMPTTFPQGGGGGGGDFSQLLSTEVGDGSDLVGIVRRGTAVRTLTSTVNDQALSVKDFGALGDGAADDTDAVHAAFAAAVSQRKSLYVPAGTYMVRGLVFQYTLNASIRIFGEGLHLSRFKHISGNNGYLLNIANIVSPSDIGPNGVTFEDIHFMGNYPETFQSNSVPYTQAAVRMLTGLVNNFIGCRFSHAKFGFYNDRGVLDRFERCSFEYSEFGYYLVGGFATTSDFTDCDAKNNYTWGIYIDDARSLLFRGGSIENNGRTGVTSGGLFAGNKTGNGGITGFLSRGVILDGTWFELNRGSAAVVLGGGSNSLTNCLFAVQNTSPVVHIQGGQYHLDNLLFENEVTTHILEFDGGVVDLGNTIRRCYVGGASRKYPNLIVNPVRTYVEWTDSGGGGGGSDVLGNNTGLGSGLIYRGFRDESGTRYLDMKSLFGDEGMQVTNASEVINLSVKVPTQLARGGIRLPTAGLDVSGTGVPQYGAWTNITLAANWTNWTGSPQAGRCRREFDVVRTAGILQYTGGASIPDGTVLGTLPVGYRPPVGVGQLGLVASGGSGLTINSGGQITVSGVVGNLISIDGVTFPTT